MGQQCCKSNTVKFKAVQNEDDSIDDLKQQFEVGNDSKSDGTLSVHGTFCKERESQILRNIESLNIWIVSLIRKRL